MGGTSPESERERVSGSLLVTVPAHNEERLLLSSVERLYSALAEIPVRWRVGVAEDGSTDGTLGALALCKTRHPDLMVQSSPKKLGRGLALRRFWIPLRFDYYIFVDADLASGTGAILSVLDALRSGADVVTGSRYVTGARVSRPPLRTAASLGYNRLVRLLFTGHVRDHQCGLKGFSRRAVEQLFPLTQEDTWFWDTEVLILATELAYSVKEQPVEWTEFRTSRTGFRRLASDLVIHGAGLIRLKSRWNRGIRAESPSLNRASVPAESGRPRSLPLQR